jgi:hypothetical protein
MSMPLMSGRLQSRIISEGTPDARFSRPEVPVEGDDGVVILLC